MFRWIIGSSLQFRFMVMAAAVALVVFGSLQLQRMPVDVFPEFEAPTVHVQTEAIGLSASEMERLVTLNLEELLSGVPWLDSIRSESVAGLSSIVLIFQRGTDINAARQMVQERLALSIFLPNVAQPPVILQTTSATSRFMMVALSSEEVEATELSMLARWTIKPKLVGIPGVANVAIWGQRLRQLQVQIDPERLRDSRVMQQDIVAAAGDSLWMSPLSFLKASTPGTGGFVDNANQRLGVHHTMPIAEPEDMAKVAVAPQHLLLTGKQMALGDVAEVTYAHPPLIGDAIVNNGGNGLLLVIDKFPSANTLEVTQAVEEALVELRRGLPGVKIDATVFRLASYIEDSLFNMAQAIIAGLVLVVIVVGALLFNWRSALISLISIPLSLFAAVIALQLTGATLNTMVLAGLLVALGVVIDDAVVHSEQLMRRIRERQGGTGPSIASLIYATTIETRGTAMYSSLIVLLAVMPILFLGGVSGAFFQPMALSYVVAVVASMVVGLTVTPALSRILLSERSNAGGESPIATRLASGYENTLGRLMAAPKPVFAAAAVVAVVGIGAWPFLGQSLLPELKERALLVNWTTPPGTSYAETNRITARVSTELQSLSGVDNVAAHIGRAVTGDQVVGINSGQIWVGLDPKADYDEMAGLVRETIDGYVGVDRSLQSYLRDTVSEVLTGASTPMVVRIFGQEREVLLQQAEAVKESLSNIDGLVDLRIDGQIEEPQVTVEVDLEKAAQVNVKPGEVRRSAATIFSGLTVGFLFDESKIFDVVVWSAPEARQSLTDLRNVLVEKSDRHHVRLGDVADVRIEQTPTVIRHDAASPYLDVVASVDGGDLGSIGREVERRLETVAFPLEYHPELLGEFVEQRSAQQRILGIAIAAVIGIFLLLQACFRSWRLALAGVLALPAAVAGGILATLVTGGVVTLGSIVGLFAVLGIAARNGVFLINYCQRLETEEGLAFGPALIARAARERLSPMLASSAAIVAALLPIVVLGQVPGLEIAQPTAIVIIGGVIASTLFTLFVLPVLYLVIGAGATRDLDLGLAAEA